MKALIYIFPLYLLIYFIYGRNNIKSFLLCTGIISIPFRTTYAVTTGSPHTGWTGGIFLALSDISFILLFLYNLLFPKNYSNYLPLKVIIAMIIYVFACSLSIWNTTAGMLTIYQIFMMIQIFFLYYYVLFKCIQTDKDIELIVKFLTLSLLFQSSLAILQFTTGNEFDYFSTGHISHAIIGEESTTQLDRAFGTIGKPNGFASYVVPLIIINLTLIISNARKNKISILSVVLGIIALIMSFSRGGWISFFISLIIVFFFIPTKYQNKKYKILLISVFIIIVTFFYPLINERVFGDDRNAAMSRIPLIKIAYNMIIEHPIIGVGSNTFRNVIHDYTTSSDLKNIYLHEVHNTYLLVFAETGILGILSFFYLIYVFYKECFYCMKKNPLIFAKYLSIGVAMGFFASNIHMLVDLYNNSLYFSSYFILGALITKSNSMYKSGNVDA